MPFKDFPGVQSYRGVPRRKTQGNKQHILAVIVASSLANQSAKINQRFRPDWAFRPPQFVGQN